MIINHNMSAINANRQMATNQANTAKSTQKLSSGLRINRAADDAAGLAISEKMRAQVSGLTQASRNAQDGISMIQTAEGALGETHSILQRMRELAVQAGNDTNVDSDRQEMQKEINQLTSEVNRIANTTEFNDKKLLNAAATPATAASGVATAAAEAKPATLTGAGNLNQDLTGASTTTVTITIGDSDKYIIDSNALKTYNNGGASALETILKAAKKDGTTDLSTVADITVGAGGEISIATKDSGANQKIKIEISGDKATEVQNLLGMTNNKEAIGEDADTATSTPTPTPTPGTPSLVSDSTIDVKLQIGANQNQTMTISFGDMTASNLKLTGTGDNYTTTQDVSNGSDNTGIEQALDVSDADKAGNAVTVINDAIKLVSAERSKIGAYQNRLEHTINNLGTSSENLTAAESRIRDVDMAEEMMEFTKNNVLSQASQAMLAQAKALPNQVLSLLQ